MLKRIIKYRLWITVAVVVMVSVMSTPLRGKGSDGYYKILNPLLMAIGLPFLYILPSQTLVFLEKIILPVVVGVVFLIMVAIPYDTLIVLLGLYDNEVDQVSNEPIANLVFYVPSVFGVIFCLNLYERYRQREEMKVYR